MSPFVGSSAATSSSTPVARAAVMGAAPLPPRPADTSRPPVPASHFSSEAADPAASASAAPRFYRDLRDALVAVYDGSAGPASEANKRDAHDFLVNLQARNVRRKLKSIEQSRCDQRGGRTTAARGHHPPQQHMNLEPHPHPPPNGPIVVAVASARFEMKSSWLACLYALLRGVGFGGVAVSSNASDPTSATGGSGSIHDGVDGATELLFSAQTLLHRLARAKLFEAIDWEVESSGLDGRGDCDADEAARIVCEWTSSPHHLHRLQESYQSWVRCVHPFVGAVADVYVVAVRNARHPSTQDDDEDSVKGELSLITIAAIMFLVALSPDPAEPHGPSTGPVLATLGASMALITLRLRCTAHPANHIGAEENSSAASTLVQTLTDAFSAVGGAFGRHHGGGGGGSNPFGDDPPPQAARALSRSMLAGLSALPDAVLGSAGGARMRVSIDPKALQRAAHQLRTHGWAQLWTAVHRFPSWDDATEHSEVVLRTLHSWSVHLPFPQELVPHLSQAIHQHVATGPENVRATALACLMVVLEGGSWTPDQVLAQHLGLSENQLPSQANKKRQSSKSRKRHKEILGTNATEEITEACLSEVHSRGVVACSLSALVWDSLQACSAQVLANHGGTPWSIPAVDGEGPIGCLAEAANACLPFLVRYHQAPLRLRDSSTPNRSVPLPDPLRLFTTISSQFEALCSSKSRQVRSLALEPLYSLHRAVTDLSPIAESLESAVVHHFFACSMKLAARCGYPDGYFDGLELNSDEELEIERNDVRDLLRTLVGAPAAGAADSDVGDQPTTLDIRNLVALKLLVWLLVECERSLIPSQEPNVVFDEVVAHAFSSLAKPLSQWTLLQGSDATSPYVQKAVELAVTILERCHTRLLDAFNSNAPQYDINTLLPLSRIANIAAASFATMTARLLASNGFRERMIDLIDVAVRAAAVSVHKIPELVAASTLGTNLYDIRGTMRAPGGEDHVGCLAIMRLVLEDDDIAQTVGRLSGFTAELCELHETLKATETKRGRSKEHGVGVTPKSRRILLNALCHIELKAEGQSGVASSLQDLFHACCGSIASLSGQTDFTDKALFVVAENVFDLASFPRPIVSSAFAFGDPLFTGCLQILVTSCTRGYESFSVNLLPDTKHFQWNRIRAALFSFLRLSSNPDLPTQASELLQLVIKSECQAIHLQCEAGPQSRSNIFHDDVVSVDRVPAGAFVRALGDVLHRALDSGASVDALRHTTTTVSLIKDYVLSSILLTCPDPLVGAFCDPRPTLAEAWLLLVSDLTSLVLRSSPCDDVGVANVICDTATAVVTLLLYPSVGRTQEARMNDPGLSFDGPQGLATTDFLARFFELGPVTFQQVAISLESRVPVSKRLENAHPTIGTAIVAAALFRAIQGGLPPWAVESIPEVFSAFFASVGRDHERFAEVIRLSMGLRLESDVPFGGVKPGCLLAGPFFEVLSPDVIDRFVEEARSLSINDDAASWRRFKVAVKQVCGGKKKESDFQLKPSYTRWEFDRL